MRCPSCNRENPDGKKFCGDCGSPLVLRCASCGAENPPRFKFCGDCGAPLIGKETANRRTGEPEKDRLESNDQRFKSTPQSLVPSSQPPTAERRQLTVLFCDLVGSTQLSEQLDPEEYSEVVQAYHDACTEVVRHHDGHVAQHLGDGLLVYFGYPLAHEDDAQRAVRTGLEIIEALRSQPPSPLRGEGQGEGEKQTLLAPTPHPNLLPQGEKELRTLPVRIGIHTGPVVISEIGSSEKREILAMGETPNLAARIQGQAEPDTVAISAVTYRLVQGLFECQELGTQTLKGITAPQSLYRIVRESTAHTRFEVAVRTGLTPLVGRDLEVGLLQDRWTQAKGSAGQVVLLSGEPGIGKSRLAEALKEQVVGEGAARLEFHCSPYHQNSAFYPILEHLQRLLQFAREDSPQTKLDKLQNSLAAYRFPQADTAALLAALLSLPHPEDTPPLTLSPQKQKQKMQEALVAWIMEEAERQAMYCVWEDLHWADPSTLELLTLFLDQVPTACVLTVLTFRPEFTPPWRSHSHITQLTLSRLGRKPVETMLEQLTGGKTLPAEVVRQIVTRTDGVPLFVEELTKSVLDAVGAHGRAPLQSLAIPTTLQDSLMARLDRLGPAKEVAQLGATLGREFSYELLHVVSPLAETVLQQELRRLVDTELLYQRGLLPQATYLFKHSLIQDTAYQSLLKSKRQQLHQQIAQVLEEQFPNTKETQPELLARHYTEANLIEQAIPYWQQAGQRASQRSAYTEAIAHLSKGMELLKALPDTPGRVQQELTVQTALGTTLSVTRGYAAPEVKQAYTRALELCRQGGETPQLFPVLIGLWRFYFLRGELQTARELAGQALRLAQSIQDPTLLLWSYDVLGLTLFHLGELSFALTYLEKSIGLYDPQTHSPDRSQVSGQDPKVTGLSYAAWVLWHLGYPNQARKKIDEALILAQELSHPFSMAFPLSFAATLHQRLGEIQGMQERTEVLVTLSREQHFPHWLAWGTIFQGAILAERGQSQEGIAQLEQGLDTMRATGAELNRSDGLAWLAKAYEKEGRIKEGLTVLAEGLEIAHKTNDRHYEAELHRLKGQLTLRSQGESHKSKVEEAEACFLKAIETARKQRAKSLELRAVMSLVRLRQQQARQYESRPTSHGTRTTQHETRIRLDEALNMLSEIYNWFTEGFDTKDLQEAKVLIEELSD